MRVYEYSKLSGIPNKELLELLNKEGFALSSHMGALTPEAIEFLDKTLKKTTQKTNSSFVKNTEAVPAESASKKEMQNQPIKPQAPVFPVQESKPEKKDKPVIHQRPTATLQAQQQQVPVKKSVAQTQTQPAVPQVVMLEPTMLADLSVSMEKPVSEIILLLLKWGIVATKNQVLSVETVTRLADHFHLQTQKPVTKKEEIKKAAQQGDNSTSRLPVVVVVGHVDHGKTTLLDFIRNTRVAAREKGGITQHLGAYEAQTKHGNIIFLDTPGHEAFSKMRSRGIKVADIAVLVVAADDSVMPQTVESLKRIKEIGIPIVVAVNKIDKVDSSRVDIVKRDLAQYDLLPEEWGGDVMYVPISAKLGTGVDHLLEMLVLQSQLMELKADAEGPAQGYVLESRIEKGRGSVATLLLQSGKLSIGDYFVCGSVSGRINSIVDSFGKRLMHVGPSIPVQIAGFDVLPEAGDFFEVVVKGQQKARVADTSKRSVAIGKKLFSEGAKNILIKTDTNSSKEALVESINKVSQKAEKGFNIVHSAIGPVTEGDVVLAADTNSEIFSLHVKVESNAIVLAQRLGVTIHTYEVIYKLLENLEQIAESAKEIKMVKKKIGEAVVRKVFDIKNIGVIAGCYVRDGIISRDAVVAIWRGKNKIGEGKLASLQRDKKSVKEVHSGFECGFVVDGFTAWEPEDRVEAFILVPAESR